MINVYGALKRVHTSKVNGIWGRGKAEEMIFDLAPAEAGNK
jgi:hypothetical protein